MPTVIEVPGQGLLEFPDGMADDEIKSIIKNKFYSEKPASLETQSLQSSPEEPRGYALNPRLGRVAGPGAVQGYVPDTHEPTESLIPGLDPENVPRGTTPATSTLSALGKTAVGAAGYATSRQGLSEGLAAASGAAPVVMLKWARDMIQGGINSAEDLVLALRDKAIDAVNKRFITANSLGVSPDAPKEEQQAQTQRIAEDVVNTLAGFGGAVFGVKGAAKGAPKLFPKKAPIEPTIPVEQPTAETPNAPASEATVPTEPVAEGTAPPVTGTVPEPAAAKGAIDASQVSQTTEVHGPVRPLETPAEVVPIERSGQGIQLQTKTGLPAKEGEVGTPGQGPGSPHISEMDANPGDPDIYGIAERVREQRAAAGQTAPIESGQGVSALEAVVHGQDVLAKDPLAGQKAVDAFNQTKAVSFEGITATRAMGEKAFRDARAIEQKFGTDSPEYRAAFDEGVKWDKASKEMQTEWHKTGMAQQGHTDIDTGSFTGLKRAFKDDTGKDFTPKQERTAKQTAAKVEKARVATEKAKGDLFEHLDKETSKESPKDKVASVQEAATKRALDAANKVVRESAARVAELENKARVAKAGLEKKRAESDLKRAQAKAKTDIERVRKAAIAAAKAEAKARVARADSSAYAWSKAREYIDKGITDFDEIRNKVATDMGVSVNKVTAALGKTKRAKYLTNELWKKQQIARRLDQFAKRWLIETNTPAYRRAIASIPKLFFTAKVFGHGTVALGTHAPMVAFQPRFWKNYVKDFGKMYHMVFSRGFYEMQVQDLLRRKNYTTARRAGLINDPYQYEDYNSPEMTKRWGAITETGNRGYAILKMLRQDMFDQHWEKLPKTAQIPEMAQAIADAVNHATGVVQVKAPKGAAVALFAPKLLASRASWLVGDPLRATKTFLEWKNATPEEKYFAVNQLKEKAWVMGTMYGILALNQGVLAAIGSDQKINGIPESMGGKGFDPMSSDFFKFKAAGMSFSYGNAMVAMARMPARLFVGIKNEGKLNKIVYEDENVATIFFEFARSQLSPFAGTATDLALGRDFQRRPLPRAGFGLLPGKTNVPKRLRAHGVKPYTWQEYASIQATPIPASEAIREVWKVGLGMSDEQIAHLTKAFAIISIMAGTGGRLTEDWDVK